MQKCTTHIPHVSEEMTVKLVSQNNDKTDGYVFKNHDYVSES